jgi:hypothetical protein
MHDAVQVRPAWEHARNVLVKVAEYAQEAVAHLVVLKDGVGVVAPALPVDVHAQLLRHPPHLHRRHHRSSRMHAALT